MHRLTEMEVVQLLNLVMEALRAPVDSARVLTPLHRCLVEHQNHEDVIRHIPLAPDTVTVRSLEAEPRVVLRMSEHDDERAAVLFKLREAGTYQLGADAASLLLGCHRDERKQVIAVVTKRVDESGFLRLSENCRIQTADGLFIPSTLVPNDHEANLSTRRRLEFRWSSGADCSKIVPTSRKETSP